MQTSWDRAGGVLMKTSRRECFDIAMSRREPEKVLLDHGKQVSSIHKNIYHAVRRKMGLGEVPCRILDRMSQCVHTDEDLLELWGVDFRWLIPNWTGITEIDSCHYRNLFGVLFQDSGDYFSISQSPLRGAGMDELNSYQWPEVNDPGQFSGLREQAEHWHRKTDYVIGADGIKGGILQTSLELAGYDQFFMDMLLNPEFAHALLDKVLSLYQGMYTNYMREIGQYIQCIYLTDDFGSQNSLLMSPDMWREFIKPREAALISHIKELAPHVKVIFHTDGSVKPLLDDMIEMGVDILNPVQTSVEELSDTAALKDEYGDRLCFHGGIDVQKVLVSMDEEEIRHEVHRRIWDLGRQGGYICCTCHNIGHDIPPGSIRAMFEAVREYQWYPLKPYTS